MDNCYLLLSAFLQTFRFCIALTLRTVMPKSRSLLPVLEPSGAIG